MASSLALERCGFFAVGNLHCVDATEQFSFQGAPFSPTFVVEVDDLPYCKIKTRFFPHPVNKIIYDFKRTSAGVIRRCPHPWYKTNNQPAIMKGGDELLFEFQLSEIDKFYNVVRSFYLQVVTSSISNLYGSVSPLLARNLLAMQQILCRVCPFNAALG